MVPMNPQLMAMMQGGGGAPAAQMGGAPGMPTPTQPPVQNVPPVSAPMTTPQPAEGKRQGAMVHAQMAIDLLEQALFGLGSETPEGHAVLNALRTLSSKFGHTEQKDKARGLIPAEVMNLVAGMPKGAGAPPMASGTPPMH